MITRHAEPTPFLAAAEPLLAGNPAVRAFIEALTGAWQRAPDDRTRPDYAATYARDGVHGVALCRHRRPMVLEGSHPEAATAFAADAPAALQACRAVVGEREACDAFARAWNLRFGTDHRVSMHMRHHVLTSLAPAPAAPGRYRPARRSDLAWLESASIAFARDARVDEAHQLILAGVRSRLREGAYRVWDDDGPLAFAGFGEAGASARIAPVYTLPERRGRGYASALVSSLAAELLAAGRPALFLFTDVGNPTSNALYARLGFRPVSDQVRLDFHAPGAALR
jgi:ribosomal protein S18 acetylase RimI-like enzyme